MDTLGVFLTILLAVFIFSGNPDVYDRLHERFMQVEKCQQVKP